MWYLHQFSIWQVCKHRLQKVAKCLLWGKLRAQVTQWFLLKSHWPFFCPRAFRWLFCHKTCVFLSKNHSLTLDNLQNTEFFDLRKIGIYHCLKACRGNTEDHSERKFNSRKVLFLCADCWQSQIGSDRPKRDGRCDALCSELIEDN